MGAPCRYMLTFSLHEHLAIVIIIIVASDITDHKYLGGMPNNAGTIIAILYIKK